jgi:hypothetical protein
MFLVIIGAVMITRNRDLAMLIGSEPRLGQWGFMASVARQNIALTGTFLVLGGLAFFVLF